VKVLSFAAVGGRGREWWTRFAWSALALAVLAGRAAAQPAAFLDLVPDFASQLADALSPGASIRLSLTGADARTREELARLLAARRIRVVDSSDAIGVRAACGSNLRERICAAVVLRDGGAPAVVTSRARAAAVHESVVAIDLQPLFTQRAPMLDVADAGAQRLVLTPDAVSLVDQSGRIVGSQPIRTSRVWPRDVRGMLHVTGAAFEAFLPGVTCRGTAAPFTLRCTDEREPWPIGLDNGGVAPSRNGFATPEGVTFYEAAAIGGGRWLVVGDQGVLAFLDARRRVTARASASDHVAGFSDSCGGDATYVVTAGRSSESRAEQLHVSRVVDDQLVPAPSMMPLPGELTSLWMAPGAHATAIVHDADAGRYEAFHISLSCAR